MNANPDLLYTLFNPRNVNALQEVLLYHIVPGLFLTEDLVGGPLQTLFGEEVVVSLDPLMFNEAAALETDILACNGALIIIDNLLIPPGKSVSLSLVSVCRRATRRASIFTNRMVLCLLCSMCTGSPVLPEICEILDFRTPEELPNLSRSGSSGMGSVFHHGRNLEEAKATSADAIIDNPRRLQFQGERCRPSMVDTALDNPLLSNFVALLDAADLADIFLCAGTS